MNRIVAKLIRNPVAYSSCGKNNKNSSHRASSSLSPFVGLCFLAWGREWVIVWCWNVLCKWLFGVPYHLALFKWIGHCNWAKKLNVQLSGNPREPLKSPSCEVTPCFPHRDLPCVVVCFCAIVVTNNNHVVSVPLWFGFKSWIIQSARVFVLTTIL